MSEHAICRIELRLARMDLDKPEHRAFANRIVGMYVNTSDGLGHDPYHWAHTKDGVKLWEGGACCKYRARVNAIDAYTNRYDAGHRFKPGDDIKKFLKKDMY